MRLFGLLGYPLEHSFSKNYFTEKWKQEGIDDVGFINFPVPDISELREIVREYPDLSGLAVTIPHKTSVIPFLDGIDPVAADVGAVNCIVINAGHMVGHNTDVIGFEKSFLKGLKPEHESVLILGNGGAAKAVSHVCGKAGLSLTKVCRSPSVEGEIHWNEVTPGLISDMDVVINCTPLGMHPEIEAFPPIPFEAIHEGQYFFDLIYNPVETVFLREAAQRGAFTSNGLEMLILQAEENRRLWNC